MWFWAKKEEKKTDFHSAAVCPTKKNESELMISFF